MRDMSKFTEELNECNIVTLKLMLYKALINKAFNQLSDSEIEIMFQLSCDWDIQQALSKDV
jgi:hypothetical protein